MLSVAVCTFPAIGIVLFYQLVISGLSSPIRAVLRDFSLEEIYLSLEERFLQVQRYAKFCE